MAGLAGSLAAGWLGAAEPLAPGDVAEALEKASAGDILVVADGVYQDVELEWSGKGAEGAPVTVRAETPGGVVFTGRSALALRGEHVTLDGFWFRDGHAPGKQAIDISGADCRLTSTVIESYNPPDPEAGDDKWVSLRGQRHVVDRCTFRGKNSRGVTLTVWRQPGAEDHHRIEGCHFLDRPKGARGNGYETVRIGASQESESVSGTVVRGNLFERCDGEMEAVSVKAGGCLLEDNTFLECAGTLTLRHGSGSRVERNLFAGKRKSGTGGVRVYGAGHVVAGNAFIGLAGRGGGALALQAGEPEPELNGYQRVEGLLVEGNLFAANEGPAIKLDVSYGEDGRALLPRGVVARANVFSGSDLEKLVEGGDRLGLELAWTGNQVFAGNQIPREITAAVAPPLSKADTGAPWYRGRLP